MTTIWKERTVSREEVEIKLSEIATKMLHHFWGDNERLKSHKIKVYENSRLSRALGRCVMNYGVAYVEMSSNLLNYGDTEVILDVLLHEVTHYALYHTNKPFKDGQPYFENELKRVGAASTNSYYVGKKYMYTCGCDNIHMSRTRLGLGAYRCKECTHDLLPSHIEFHDGVGGVITEEYV